MSRRVRFATGLQQAFILCLTAPFVFTPFSRAQTNTNERVFPQSKAAIERALKELQASSSGHLPTLEGFAVPGERSLDRFRRGYYQCTVQVSAQPTGGSLVRVSAKITAWYEAPAAAQSGYQVLASNGRLESDFLDRLDEVLGHDAAPTLPVNQPAKPESVKTKSPGKATSAPTAAGPVPDAPSLLSPAEAFRLNRSPEDQMPSTATQKAVADRHLEALRTEAKNLEEILRNQSHPTNLIAVKKAGTPVLATPNEGGKVVFLASAEDEFEMLDLNADWVHIRISGLSRGWLLRSSVEMNGASVSNFTQADAPARPSAKPANMPRFQVEREEMASFPAAWEPLRGRTVKIVSVQQATPVGADLQAKLDVVKSLFSKEYTELTQAPTTAAGVVVIFDSADGGMLATTLGILRQWKEGTLSDEALWRRCYVDPPEMFGGSLTP